MKNPVKAVINPRNKRFVVLGIIVGLFVLLRLVLNASWLAVLTVYLMLALGAAIFNIWAIIAFYGNYCFSSGKEERAEKIFAFCIRHKSPYPTVYLNYSIMLLRKGMAKEALGYLEKAANRTPKIITEKNIILTMGSCYWALGEIDRAIEVLEGLRKKYDYVNCHVLSTLAYMYFLKEDYDKALELSNKALEDTPDFSSAWDNIGQIYYKTGRTAEAKEAFLKAVESRSDLVDSLYYLARIAEDENDTENASLYYEKAMGCKINALNTVTKEQVAAGFSKFSAGKP